MSTARGPFGSWLAPALVGLAAAAAGLGGGWFLRGSQLPPIPPSAPPPLPIDGPTREELEAAKREILAELEFLGRQRSSGASSAAGPEDGAVNELGRRIAELETRVALVDLTRAPANRGVAWDRSRGPGSASIESIGERIREWDEREQAGGQVPDVTEQLLAEHHLWTIEDIIRSYGPPRRVTSSDGLVLYYGRFKRENIDEPCVVNFRVVEGFVIEVGCDCGTDW